MTRLTKGMRVRYTKQKYSRANKLGTVTGVDYNNKRFSVLWEGEEYSESYSWDAYQGYNQEHGYIVLTAKAQDTEGRDLYPVCGRNGGPIQRVFDGIEAHRVAQQQAQASDSGQEYVVFRAATGYQRSAPPVERKDYDTVD